MGECNSKPGIAPSWDVNYLVGASGGRPADTVIIFDWDDTLLCSSAVNMQQCEPSQLQQLETTIEQVVSAALRLGETHIVTNGNGTWVQESSRRFVPKVIPLLNRLKRVVSARAEYEHVWPNDPFTWKKAAFEELLRSRQDDSQFSSSGVNLIALGDNQAEIEAAQSATSNLRGQSVVKTVKFKEFPSVDELLGQLRVVMQLLPELVNADTSQNKALVPRWLPPNMAYLTSWASGWRVVDHAAGVVLDTTSPAPLVMPQQGIEVIPQQPVDVIPQQPVGLFGRVQ